MSTPAVQRHPSLPGRIVGGEGRLADEERNRLPATQEFGQLRGVQGSPTAHGRVPVYVIQSGKLENRFSERAPFSFPGPSSGWTLGESGPWPLLAGYVGEIYAVALGLRVAGTSDTTVEFWLNGTAFHTLTLGSGITLVVFPTDATAVTTGIQATTGSMDDYLSVNLTAAGTGAEDLTAHARHL